MQKIVSSLLACMMLFSFVGSTFAESNENNNLQTQFTDAELLNLDLAEIDLDDSVHQYIDTINSDIDFNILSAMEEEISSEGSESFKESTRVKRNPIVIAALIKGAAEVLKKYGFPFLKATYHLGLRMYQRGVSPGQVINAITKGKKYYDPKYGSTVYYYDGVAIGRQGNALTTTYKTSSPKGRWVPQ